MSIAIDLNKKSQLNDEVREIDPKFEVWLVLIYVTHRKLDIFYHVSLISRFMHTPRKAHFAAGKEILRYFQESKYFWAKVR